MWYNACSPMLSIRVFITYCNQLTVAYNTKYYAWALWLTSLQQYNYKTSCFFLNKILFVIPYCARLDNLLVSGYGFKKIKLVMQLQEEHTDNKAHWHLFRYCEKKQLYIFILLFSKSCFIVAFAIIEHVTKIMCYKKLASRLWPMLFILTDFFLLHTLFSSAAK